MDLELGDDSSQPCAHRHPLVQRLLAASARSARFAMTHYSNNDEDDRLMSAVRAGMAVEFLLLAALADRSPILLASVRGAASVKSRVLLASLTDASSTSLSGIATIDVIDAFDAVLLLHPQVTLQRADIPEFLTVRNAAIHLAYSSRESVERAIAIMARVNETILNAVGFDRAEYWSPDLLASVSTTVAAAEEAVLRRTLSKMALAASNLESLTLSVDADERYRLFELLESRTDPLVESEESITEDCPVCGRQARLYLEVVEADDVQEENDEDGHYLWVDRQGFPQRLLCPVCRLGLEGDEIVKAIPNLPASFELESRLIHPEEYYAEWEPDEDWLRER